MMSTSYKHKARDARDLSSRPKLCRFRTHNSTTSFSFFLFFFFSIILLNIQNKIFEYLIFNLRLYISINRVIVQIERTTKHAELRSTQKKIIIKL